MKKNILNRILLYGMCSAVCMVTSCDYLDVTPPEQPDVDDTMQNRIDAIEFISSCYLGVEKTSPFGQSSFEWGADEAVDPPQWGNLNQRTAWNLWSSASVPSSKENGYWENLYNYIGHCHMFLNLLSEYDPKDSTPEDKARWKAEAEFLKAYYHFKLLSMYGPVPVMDQRPSTSTLPTEFPGRSHYDYVVNYIVDKLDEVFNTPELPDECGPDDWGRATKSAVLAVKARTLLYAASDLWNGKFPYPNWKNTNYETPEYGKALVSSVYDEQKWRRALDANLQALEYAEDKGNRHLLSIDESDVMALTQQVKTLPTIPGKPASNPDNEDFLKRVQLMRYVVNSDENDGNKEIIWGVFMQENNKLNYAPWPKHIIMANSNWVDGWCLAQPTLYSIEHFYTEDGKLPEKDNTFYPKEEWFERAGLPNQTCNNGDAWNKLDDIIKLNVRREPRFYANFSFDGDIYSEQMKNGKPMIVDLLNSEEQGYNPVSYPRDWPVTGYFSKKYTAPDINVSSSGTRNLKNYAKPLFRLAELYLNVAECYAALGEPENALIYLNPIRKRAGVPELTLSDITDDMTIMDWVRNERFVELWGEGHRYYDVRRWMTAPELLKAGVREGLNAECGMDPAFEEFNKRVTINQQFQWDDRMYMWPILSTEIYNDSQLIQAPGY